MFFSKPAITEPITDDISATGTYADGLLQLTEKELMEFARKDFSGTSFKRDYGAARQLSECRIAHA